MKKSLSGPVLLGIGVLALIAIAGFYVYGNKLKMPVTQESETASTTQSNDKQQKQTSAAESTSSTAPETITLGKSFGLGPFEVGKNGKFYIKNTHNFVTFYGWTHDTKDWAGAPLAEDARDGYVRFFVGSDDCDGGEGVWVMLPTKDGLQAPTVNSCFPYDLTVTNLTSDYVEFVVDAPLHSN